MQCNREEARRAGNPLCLGPEAYRCEWRDNIVRLQQAFLRQNGWDGDAEILGDEGPLPPTTGGGDGAGPSPPMAPRRTQPRMVTHGRARSKIYPWTVKLSRATQWE